MRPKAFPATLEDLINAQAARLNCLKPIQRKASICPGANVGEALQLPHLVFL
jgi:hypothetical protein